MADLVIGVFDSAENASNAIDDLKEAGYRNEQISVIARETAEFKALRDSKDSDVAEDTAKGAVTGGVVGALAGLLIGAGVLALPPVGGILIAGPIAAALGISTAGASALAGAGIGAAGGGLIAALRKVGLSEEDATTYERILSDQGVLIAVDDRGDEDIDLTELLHQNGANEVRTASTDSSVTV